MNKYVVWFAAVAVAVTNAQFKCPNDKYGQYRDEVQCDKYYECIDGRSTEKLCADGLVFDETIRLKNKCDQPFNVDCEDRIELQPPKSTRLCPRKNGFFAHPDASVCNIFYNCIDSEAIEIKCTAGLHFDEYTGTCVWPDSIKREGCNAENRTTKDGFECPTEAIKGVDVNGQTIAHPRFPHPTDCQRFYVCLNGVDARDLGCQVGQVYNDVTQNCDAPENVPGCEDWYTGTEEEVKETKRTK